MLVIAVVGYLAFEYLWEMMFTNDEEVLNSAFRLNRDENGNIIKDATKVVILYCKFCGSGRAFDKI